MASLVSLAPEILEDILVLLDPVDVSCFSRTSRYAHDFCAENEHLWRALFLRLWDHPVRTGDEPYPYRRVLESRIRARGLINLAREPGQLSRIVSAFPPLLSTFTSIAHAATSPTSKNIQFLADLFPPSATAFTGEYISAYTDPMRVDVAGIVRREAAHFSALHGPTSRSYEGFRRLLALRKVYMLSNYTRATNWGPYEKDGSGRVDWEVVDADRVVSDFNVMTAVEREGWGTDPDTGIGLLEQVGRGKSGGWADMAPREMAHGGRDWAGVERTWIGTYAFLDIEVLEALNSPEERNAPGLRGTLRLGDLREAIGDLMHLKLTLDPPSPTTASSSSSEFDEVNPYPRLTFKGTLEHRYGTPNTTTPVLEIVGSVSRGPAPEYPVRWTYLVRYGGAAQWALEGVQIGGMGSKAGVRGVWTHAARMAPGWGGAAGPVGPFTWWQAD